MPSASPSRASSTSSLLYMRTPQSRTSSVQLFVRIPKALENEPNYDKYMEGMAKARKLLPDTKFIIMTYENTVLEIGVSRFVAFCKENGFEDIILVGPDGDTVKNELIDSGLKISCYVQFNLPEEEVRQALESNGFTYMQAVPAPGQATPQHPTLRSCIDYLRERGLKNPIYCGVGVHTPEDAQMVKEAGGDGIFVGSTILKLHDNVPALIEKIHEFKEKC
jgi:tryptophan synthase alpha chain